MNGQNIFPTYQNEEDDINGGGGGSRYYQEGNEDSHHALCLNISPVRMTNDISPSKKFGFYQAAEKSFLKLEICEGSPPI